MRKIIMAIIIILISFPAYSGMWCEWNGSKGVNCQNDNLGFIKAQNGFKIRSESIANSHGIFKVIPSEPALTPAQTKDAEIWSKVDNKLNLTWSIRDLTSDEIDSPVARPMPISEYYLWKVLILKGVVTKAELADRLPQKLKDAYLARERLDK